MTKRFFVIKRVRIKSCHTRQTDQQKIKESSSGKGPGTGKSKRKEGSFKKTGD
jgi:hypothetical protein